MRVEILTDPKMFPRGARMLDAMIAAAPSPPIVREKWSGSPGLLMVYGTGHPVRRPWQFENLRRGGRLIGWDLGYWGRRTSDGSFYMRCTMDADHPQALIRPEPPHRWDAAGIALREDFDPRGRIVVVGMGPKAHRAHGFSGFLWEQRALRNAAKAYPDREIVFRPKRPTDPRIPGFSRADGTIEETLRGASLIICRHSNVAVDACIAGVPVACEDGAAAALYGPDVKKPVRPTREQRLAFLQSLAWWQWKPEEAADAWTYLLCRLSG